MVHVLPLSSGASLLEDAFQITGFVMKTMTASMEVMNLAAVSTVSSIHY